MMSIDTDAIRRRVDARDVADDLGADVTARAGRWWSLRCPRPDHHDADPSAGVSADGWRCHGCGASGDVFDLVEIRRGCDFRQAVDWLRARIGATDRHSPSETDCNRGDPPESTPTSAGSSADRARNLLTWIHSEAESPDAIEPAAEYLRGRGLSVACAAREGIRAARPADWRALRAHVSADVLRAAGLMAPDGDALQPFWWHKGAFLLCPYRDGDGQVATLRFRRCFEDDGPKAMSLRRAAGDMHRPPRPFGAPHQPRLAASVGAYARQRPLYVVEGAPDAVALWQTGRRAVASPSADQWHDGWCAGWDRLRAVAVLIDGDEAGRQLPRHVRSATAEAFGAAWCDERLSVWSLAGGRDANDALNAGQLRSSLDAIESELGALEPVDGAPGRSSANNHRTNRRAAVLAERHDLDADRAATEADRRGGPARLTESHRHTINQRICAIDTAAPWTGVVSTEE